MVANYPRSVIYNNTTLDNNLTWFIIFFGAVYMERVKQMFASDKYFEENKYNHDFHESDLKNYSLESN